MTLQFMLRALLLAAAFALPGTASAQSVSPQQRGEIETIIRDYLIKNPEVLQEAIAELEKKQARADSEKHQAAVKDNAEAIFNSARHVVVGNPQGDVTLVEFFDYRCGYCKRALEDLNAIMKDDPKLRVVLKEFPVLGPESVEAARIAVAVRMQDPTGKKYFSFHQKLLNARAVDRARALDSAKEAGLDVARIQRDMNSDEVKLSLEESFRLAQSLGLNGTPSYVIGKEVVVGAVGVSTLKEKIAMARCGKATC